MKKSLLVALAAGAAVPMVTVADVTDRVINSRAELGQLHMGADGVIRPGTPAQSRATVVVYDGFPGTTTAGSVVTSLGAFNGIPGVAEDLNFAPGPWATGTSTMNSFVVPLTRQATPVLATGADLFVRFWDNADFNLNPAFTGTPFYTFYGDVSTLPADGGQYILTITPATPVAVPGGDSRIFVTMEFRNSAGVPTAPGAPLSAPVLTTSAILRTQPFQFYGWFNNVLVSGDPTRQLNVVGSTTIGFMRDIDGDAIFEGGAITQTATPGLTANEHVQVFSTSTAFPPESQGLDAAVRVDFTINGESLVVATPPTADQTITTLSDGVTLSNTLQIDSASADPRQRAVWIQFGLANDVTDARSAFLDIDFDTSVTTVADPALVLFDGTGDEVAQNDDDGIADLAMLSFGLGLRPSAGADALEFAGYDGELLAANGPFWLGVAAVPVASAVTDGWGLISNASISGDVRVRFNTNVNAAPNGLPASVAPDVRASDIFPAGGLAGDPLFDTGDWNDGAAILPGDPGVAWWTFTTCKSVDVNDPDATDFVDIDTTLSIGTLDHEIFLFDNSGNLVVTNDDRSTTSLEAALSFGNAGPRPARDVGGPDFTGGIFDGTNTVPAGLPAGQYWIAIAFFDAATLTPGTRWHIRPETPNDNLNLQAAVRVGFAQGDCDTGSACDSVDFNNDGVFPDDSDLADFIFVLGGGSCALCNDVDFNNDGVFPDDSDLATFLFVLGGGAC